MNSNDLITLFFLVAAVVIFFQLRNVLGRRTGNEKPPSNYNWDAKREAENEKIVTLPSRDTNATSDEPSFAAVDAVAVPGTVLNNNLRDLQKRDPSFQPKDFLKGVRAAYEMIVMAYAQGDRGTLKNLLSSEVYAGFDHAIAEREAQGEKVKSTFVGISKADMTHADITDSEAQITVRIKSELISATYDKNDALVDGDADNVAEVNDVWTFARDLRSRDPNWKLVATESEA